MRPYNDEYFRDIFLNALHYPKSEDYILREQHIAASYGIPKREFVAGIKRAFEFFHSKFEQDVEEVTLNNKSDRKANKGDEESRQKSLIEAISDKFSFELFSGYIFDALKTDFAVKSVTIHGISEKLSKWIDGASDRVLSEIIINNRLPERAEKPVWKGTIPEAHFFMWWCGIQTEGEFLNLFYFEGVNAKKMNKNQPQWKRGGYTDEDIRKWSASKKDGDKNLFYKTLLKIVIPKE